jgi:hypothetical protein
MGGTLSSQSGGAHRTIKEIQDDLAAAKAKSPLDEMEITKLSDELSAAFTEKEKLVSELNELEKAGTNAGTVDQAQINAVRSKLHTLAGENITVNNVSSTVGTNSLNDISTVTNDTRNTSNTNNTLAIDPEELEKCKKKAASEAAGEPSIEEAKERTKTEVPGFFSGFFGNWFSYDYWQQTEDEKERNRCKELISKAEAQTSPSNDDSHNNANVGSVASEDSVESNISSISKISNNNTIITGSNEVVPNENNRGLDANISLGTVNATVGENEPASAAAPASESANGNAAAAAEAAAAPASESANGNAAAAAPANAEAKPVAKPAVTGGNRRRHTYKKRTRANKTLKAIN